MKRRTRKQLPGLIAKGAIFTACFLGMGYMSWQSMGQVVADQYGCFPDAGAPQTIVMVDASNPRWDETQQRALYAYFNQLYEQLKFNEKLLVYTTEGDQLASVPAPRFHVCGQAKSSNELISVGGASAQDGYLRKQKQRLYEKQIRPELDTLLSLSPDEARQQNLESPIFEFIRSVTRTTKPQEGDRLVVISDAIQNSETLKFCRIKNDMPAFRMIKARREYQERLKPEPLTGVSVEFLMLLREGYGQQGLDYCYSEEELRGVWRDYFIDNDVENPSFIRIRHGINKD